MSAMPRCMVALAIVFAFLVIRADECPECISVDLNQVDEVVPSAFVYDWSNGESETNKIDLLIAFDGSAQKWLDAQGYVSAEDFASGEVACINVGLSNTGLDQYFTFRLAGTAALESDLSAIDIMTIIYDFTGRSKPGTSREKRDVNMILGARDSVAADIVVILVDCADKSTSGISYKFTNEYLSTSGLRKLAKYAYCVCDISKLATRFTLMHELGHVLGAGHDDEQKTDPGPQLQSYSSGYRFEVDGVLHTTVMGITASYGKTFIRWPFFSSPLYEFGDSGVPVGTAQQHDNTRTLRETYPIVANFRVATPLPSPIILLSVVRVSDSGGDDVITSSSVVQSTRYVHETFRISAGASNSAKTTVTVKGLPKGLKYASKTGTISGFPKKAGRYTVTVKATGKGCEAQTLSFVISVSNVPSWVLGTYVGVVEIDDLPSLVTLTLSSAGKVSMKVNIKGQSRTFTVAGMEEVRVAENGEKTFIVQPSGKVGKKTRTFTLRLMNRLVESEDFIGQLYQNPWGRKDVAGPKIAKTFKTTNGDYTVKIKSNGKVLVSGKPNGVAVSGTFQLVSTDDFSNLGDEVTCLLPVVFQAKKAFGGLAEVWTVKLSVGAGNKVSRVVVSGGAGEGE